ncbi:acyl carrier protein [Breoghania sp.]|uniref:acyl carrier protein n=1 Tax=Breoghania sp. TaxID=2065378 RepID=UPI002AA891D9|nr:acyl carrier protein [Breoghania sp.]
MGLANLTGSQTDREPAQNQPAILTGALLAVFAGHLRVMDKIREFIEEQFLIEFDESFPETSDLFKEGVMDSFGYIQLIRFLEKEFDIKFTEQEITGGVMVSLTQIEQAVQHKVAARAS